MLYSPFRPEAMTAPSPVSNILASDQEVPCLIDMGSDIAVMEYKLYDQWLGSGYWQVPAKEQDREKTAFITLLGLFKFNHMPFGLSNALSTFQHLMQRGLGDFNF